MKVLERMGKIIELQNLKTPWEVMRSGIRLEIAGDQINLTNATDADFLTITEARVCAKWLAEQLGFVVSNPTESDEDVNDI